MKENIIDVLMYLLEHYIDEEVPPEPNRGDLEDHLLEAGFGNTQVSRAFDWLEELASLDAPHALPAASDAMRVYRDNEATRLGQGGMGFLHFLEHSGVLSPANREQVIERVLALDTGEIDLDQLKWVVLMVLFNQPDDDSRSDLDWLEDIVYNEPPLTVH